MKRKRPDSDGREASRPRRFESPPLRQTFNSQYVVLGHRYLAEIISWSICGRLHPCDCKFRATPRNPMWSSRVSAQEPIITKKTNLHQQMVIAIRSAEVRVPRSPSRRQAFVSVRPRPPLLQHCQHGPSSGSSSSCSNGAKLLAESIDHQDTS